MNPSDSHFLINKQPVSDQQTPFSYVVTQSATDKVFWQAVNTNVNDFISSFINRGHRVGNKEGTGIVAAKLVPGTRLEDKNVQAVTALILDVDGKIRENGVESHKYIDPDTFLSRLPFRGVVHTSYNHSADLAKFRVIFPLAAPVSKEEYLRLWFWAFEECGRTCDPACKNPSRMFYLPRRSADVDPALHWIRELQGPLLSLEAVPADFKPTGPGALLLGKKKTGLHVNNSSGSKWVAADPLAVVDELINLPIYEWALAYPTDVSREAWRGLATNLGALVLDEAEMYEPCSQAFHDLSRVDRERYDYGTCERTFRDAVKSAHSVGPMTFDTLRIAGAPEDACLGYQERSPVAVARARVARKAREVARQNAMAKANTLTTDITVAPPPPLPVQPVAPTPPPPAPVVAAPPPPPPASSPDGSNGDPGGEGGPSSVSKWQDPSRFVFDATENAWFHWNAAWSLMGPINDQAFTRLLLANGHDKKNLEGFKSLIPHVHGRRMVYSSLDRIVTVEGVQFLNTYRPTQLPAVPGDWSLIRELVLNLVGQDKNGLEYVLDWIAVPLQSIKYGKPKKMGTAIVFRGAQGSGKGTLSKLLELMYGAENFTELDQDGLDSRFNDAVVAKLFVVANEVVSSTNRSGETTNKLKPWITDNRIVIERKYHGRSVAENNFNLIFTSNDYRPVIIERTDRRHSVFDSNHCDKKLLGQIWDDIGGRQEQVSAFYAHLLTRNTVVGFGDLYKSKSRTNLILASQSSAEQFAVRIADDGWLSVSRTWVNSATAHEAQRHATEHGGLVPADTFRKVYEHFCREVGLRALPSDHVAKLVKDTIPKAYFKRQVVGKVRIRAWHNLPLHAFDDVADNTDTAPDNDSEESDTVDNLEFN